MTYHYQKSKVFTHWGKKQGGGVNDSACKFNLPPHDAACNSSSNQGSVSRAKQQLWEKEEKGQWKAGREGTRGEGK